MATAGEADKVMKFVEGQLKKDPQVSNATLFEGAKKIDRGVGKLSNRQFHAKYPLQVKRRKGQGRRNVSGGARRISRSRRGRGSNSGDREAVRRVLLSFARDLSAADSQVATIDVLSDLDRYTNDILKSTHS